MGRRKTIGDVIREQMAVIAKGNGGTREWREFLELPAEDRFNSAGTLYAAALEMLNEAVTTVEDLMFQTVLHTSRPVGRTDPRSDAAVIRAWQFLQDYGRLPKPGNLKVRCTCRHRRIDHFHGEEFCSKCACTWFHSR